MSATKIKIDREGLNFYVGDSSDTKPDPDSVPAGSRFVETDTGLCYVSHASAWTRLIEQVSMREFTPSAYSANKSATTTVTGQSEAVASGATKIRVRNLDAANYARIAFGVSANDAETNAANGVAVEFGQVEVLGIPAAATHYAWLGDTGTVVLNIQQGN